MHNDQAYAARQELYVVEVDGVQKSEHRIFVEALKCGMELKIRYPRSKVMPMSRRMLKKAERRCSP